MGQQWDVIVVGGGLAGLAAGATATAGGARTLVLEAGAVGGRARTHTESGFVFNLGGHALYLGGPGSKVLSKLGVPLAGATGAHQQAAMRPEAGSRHAAAALRAGVPL